jgi:DNA polymerase-2
MSSTVFGKSVGECTPQYILSRHWQDSKNGIELRYWLVNAERNHCWVLTQQESTCFISFAKTEQWQGLWRRLGISVRVGERTFKSLMGDTVVPVYTKSYKDQRRWVWQGRDLGLQVWEDDINPADRYLTERFLFGGVKFENDAPKPANVVPDLKVLSIDIETSWFEPGKTPDLYSVALAAAGLKQVFVVSNVDTEKTIANDIQVIECTSVKRCLMLVIDSIQKLDPDCIIGWNVIDFDLRILQNHCDSEGVLFEIGRHKLPPTWRSQSDNKDRFYINVEGRQIVDGPGAFRSAAWMFDDYSLETVSRTLLNRGKKIEHSDDRVGEIERMYREDPEAFAQYNFEDAQLVIELFDIAGLWHFLIERSHLTGLPMDRSGGSSAAFNTVYMPRLHRKGYVASSIGEQTLQLSSPGGFVMESKPGIYNDVLVLDFKSLYPSIIRTFLIDPLGLNEGLKSPEDETIPGFLDARFHREEHILPALIDQLWQARDQAKKEKNAPMSQAIKIIMNSFYGVLGSDLCRFFDPRLASSITMRGHEILQTSAEFIRERGFDVIYGDTDSVFVHAKNHENPKQLGAQLARELNVWWVDHLRKEFNLECRLEMEFETHYNQFVMPTIRGTEKGSKKRYAGWVETDNGPKLIFKGLEAVRSDWTQLAKQFQTHLYEKIFQGEDHRTYIANTVAELKEGKLDELLVYRRRLRRSIDQYEKQIPPQVQAAKLKKQQNPNWHGRNIEYVKTVQGWQPIPYVTSNMDYQHYIEKQLEPIADAILHFLDEDFNSLIDEQMRLF